MGLEGGMFSGVARNVKLILRIGKCIYLIALGACDKDSILNIHCLLEIACMLPISCAEAERWFSLLNISILW